MHYVIAPKFEWVRSLLVHRFVKALGTIPRLRRHFKNLEIKPANRFADGCFVPNSSGRTLCRGGQMPQAWLRNPRSGEFALSDDVIGVGFCMVGFGVDPCASMPKELVARWHDAGGRLLRIGPCGTPAIPPAEGYWEDFSGVLMPGQVPLGWLAVVRPDKTVMHDGPAAEAQWLIEQCLRILDVQGAAGERRRNPWPMARVAA